MAPKIRKPKWGYIKVGGGSKNASSSSFLKRNPIKESMVMRKHNEIAKWKRVSINIQKMWIEVHGLKK